MADKNTARQSSTEYRSTGTEQGNDWSKTAARRSQFAMSEQNDSGSVSNTDSVAKTQSDEPLSATSRRSSQTTQSYTTEDDGSLFGIIMGGIIVAALVTIPIEIAVILLNISPGTLIARFAVVFFIIEALAIPGYLLDSESGGTASSKRTYRSSSTDSPERTAPTTTDSPDESDSETTDSPDESDSETTDSPDETAQKSTNSKSKANSNQLSDEARRRKLDQVTQVFQQLQQLSQDLRNSVDKERVSKFKTRIKSIEQEITELQDYPLTDYLDESDLEKLDTIRQELSEIEQELEYAVQACEQIPRLQHRFERIYGDLQPDSASKPSKGALQSTRLTEVLYEDVQEVVNNIDDELLPVEKRIILTRLEWLTAAYSGHSEAYQGTYLNKHFDKTVSRLTHQIPELSARVAKSSDEDVLERETDLSASLDDIQREIRGLRIYPLEEYLSKQKISKLDSLQQQANDTKKQLRGIKATARLTERLPEWDERLAHIDDRMDPYFEYEQYELESDILDDVSELHDEISAIKHSAELGQLPIEDRDHFREIKQKAEAFSTHLHNYQDECVQRQFLQQKDSLRNSVDQLQKQQDNSKAKAGLLTDESNHHSLIADVSSSLEALREYPLKSHLTSTQLAEIDSIEEHLDTAKNYFNAKEKFDSHIRSVQHSVAIAEQLAVPYLTYSQYLSKPARTELETAWNTASKRIKQLRHGTDLDILGVSDQTAFKDAAKAISKIQSTVDGYNDEFVRRERNRYKDFFKNIGPRELDLTPDQQRAVIRNGIYNQVIAGAGTGKTLVLTTRVAYLIRTQDVDPSQILVVAYTNEASDEMEARLEAEFGITDVEVRTVHAFGNQLIRATETERTSTADEQTALNVIDREIQRARDWNAEEFLDHYYQFLLHLDDVAPKQADFETKEAYVEARAAQDYETLRGEDVKSRAEKSIADFLFTHQVEYRYEELATWADTGADKSAYEPDFYLPEHDIHIEHWGLDTAGAVAPWFSQTSEDYRKKMRWARTQFADADARLVETYDFEHAAGWLDKALRHRLTESGVTLDRLSFEELVNSTFEYNKREKWIKDRFSDFIQNAKQFNLEPDTITEEITPANQRQFHFARCGLHLLQQYHRYLVENDLVDYADMVQQAADIVRSNPDASAATYDHILVDEFQDIGHGKIELIQGLTGPDKAKLFAVGDDWQSIYSFQGAVVEYFINFEEHLGKPVQTTLHTNFRSPEQIVTASSDLISNNEVQLSKTIDTNTEQDTTPRVHALRGHSFYDYVHRVTGYALRLVQQYLSEGADPSEIMILCRYDGAVPYLDDIKQALQDNDIPYTGKNDRDQYRGPDGTATDGVSVYSLYQAKGREAKHVILVHAAEGPYGFPPENRDNELLDPVQPFDLNTLAEERRAFYVALTRTQHTLDLLTRSKQESRFLSEIVDYTDTVNQSTAVEPLDDVGSTMSITARVDRLFDAWDKQHQAGILEDQYGGSARFVSWESDDPPTLVPDEWYRFDGVRVSEFNDEKEVIVSSRSTLTHIENQETVIENIVNTNDNKSEPVN